MSLVGQQKQIEEGLLSLFEGKDKFLSILACLSISATTARMIGLPKLELQKILIRCYDRRIEEELSEPTVPLADVAEDVGATQKEQL